MMKGNFKQLCMVKNVPFLIRIQAYVEVAPTPFSGEFEAKHLLISLPRIPEKRNSKLFGLVLPC